MTSHSVVLRSLLPVILIGCACFAVPRLAYAAQLSGEHCTVTYSGIDQAYAQALANVCDSACEGFIATFALQPAKHISIKVETGAYATQLWTDGKSYLYFDLADADDLQPGSGYNNIYGVCHELGHITMYSKLSTLAGLPDGVGEGWAHYTGSLVTDYVWGDLGIGAWPQPYDYSVNGSARLRGQCAQGGDDAMTTAACTFLAIGDKYTHKKVGQVMKGALGTEPAGNELMGRFARVLEGRTDGNASSMIPDSVRKSPIVPQGDVIVMPSATVTAASAAAVDAWINDEGWIGYDDNAEDDMRSLAGSGHAVKYHVPGGGKLEAVQLKGGRYGMPRSESTFRLAILNGDFETIRQWELPYMEFMQRGTPLYWEEFDTANVEVPADFFVCFDFNPSATDGVYVGLDADSAGHSYTALPGSHIQSFREGDWMIRAKIGGAAPIPVPTGEPKLDMGRWTGYDDDSEDGMRSIAGGAHGVKFHVRGGGKLKKVKLKGARYGMPNSNSRFNLAVLDSNRELIQIWDLPFMKFEQRGEPLYWVEFDTRGVEVPADFYVVFTFGPTATDGVYVGYDADSIGHSYDDLSGNRPRDFRDGDWMIRALAE